MRRRVRRFHAPDFGQDSAALPLMEITQPRRPFSEFSANARSRLNCQSTTVRQDERAAPTIGLDLNTLLIRFDANLAKWCGDPPFHPL